jgi:hypothetical protein
MAMTVLGLGPAALAFRVAGVIGATYAYDNWIEDMIPEQIFGMSTRRAAGLDLGDVLYGLTAALGFIAGAKLSASFAK